MKLSPSINFHHLLLRETVCSDIKHPDLFCAVKQSSTFPDKFRLPLNNVLCSDCLRPPVFLSPILPLTALIFDLFTVCYM